jgi:beta-glucosidase
MTAFDRTFPDGFLWGTATASYQIEGAAWEDGRTPSIWDTFSKTPGKVLGGDTGDVACDHYHRLEDDVTLMRTLGITAYRFSIAWPRIIPTGTGEVNQAGVDFYARLVDLLLENDIRPFATLYHWDLPQVLEDQGGWLNRDSAAWFAEYAAAVTGPLGDRVKNWTTLNEPWCSALLGYSTGQHAPGHTSVSEGLVAAHHLMLAHGTAVPVIREQVPDAEVSITLNFADVRGPVGQDVDPDAWRRADNAHNAMFLDPILRGSYPEGFLDDTAAVSDHAHLREGDLDVISAPLDNLGVNYYSTQRVAPREKPEPSAMPGCDTVELLPPEPPLTGIGWEIDPTGLTALLTRIASDYGNPPVYITENGSAWPDEVDADGGIHDDERVTYLRGHLAAVADALEAGADIRGYFAWSLMDNFEWAYGYSQRFGLVYVDYETQARTVKDSGHEYALIIRDQQTLAKDLGAALRDQ